MEELDPMIERALTYMCGKYGLPVKIRGKKTGDMPLSGENTLEIIEGAMKAFMKKECDEAQEASLSGTLKENGQSDV